MRKEKEFRIGSLIVIITLLIFPAFQSRAAVVWSDNFDDGNYDGWTTPTGGITAENGYLECNLSTAPSMGNRIYYESTVDTGTWSFDFFYVNGGAIHVYFWGDSTAINTGVVFTIWIDGVRLQLWRGTTTLTSWGSDTGLANAWNHVDVTVDESFNINIFLNSTHRIHYKTVDPASSCEYFGVGLNLIGECVDNIVVSDSIDLLPNDTYIETTTTPTTTTSDTTDTHETIADTPFPIEIIAITVGIGVILVVIVAYIKLKK